MNNPASERLLLGGTAPEVVTGVVELGTALIGHSHPSSEVLERRLARSPESLAVIMTPREGELRVLAYSLVYPLTAQAVERIVALQIRSGADLEPDHLCSAEGAAGFYLAMVANACRRGLALRLFVSHLSFLVARSCASVLAARTATREGALLIRKRGFQKLPDPSQIWLQFIPEGWAGTAVAGKFELFDVQRMMEKVRSLAVTTDPIDQRSA
jgi:hypothetical protein